MVTVDQKGRIVLPQAVRDRLGIVPGSEVDVREEDGKAVVEPEDDPDKIIDRMNELVEETSPPNGETAPVDDVDPVAQNHRDVIRRGAQQAAQSDE